MRSPFAKVRVLLSSNTLLRFSIHMASTGPSRTIQICSPEARGKRFMNRIDIIVLFLQRDKTIFVLREHPQTPVSRTKSNENRDISVLTNVSKGRYTRGSLLLQHAPATRSRSKAPSSAPTISSEKICCAAKLLLPSFAPSYQTGLI